MIKCDVEVDHCGNITVYPVAKRHNYPSLFFQEGFTGRTDFIESLSKYSQKAVSEGFTVRVNITDDYFQDTDFEEHLMEILPHGSGIDCDWEFSEQKDGKIVCKNSWHLMNEDGYYIGYIDFSIRFHRTKPLNFILQFHTNKFGHRMLKYHGIREYLNDDFTSALDKFET